MTFRTVTTEECNQMCATLPGCSFVETSAKKNINVDDLFRELFRLADLPPEMAPNSHRRLLPGQVCIINKLTQVAALEAPRVEPSQE